MGVTPVEAAVWRRPSLRAFAVGIGTILQEAGVSAGAVEVVSRAPHVYRSTFPAEVVVCRLAGGRELRLFCKYGRSERQDGHGHRGGLAHEAAVHRAVLGPLGPAVPRLYGVANVATDTERCLVFEYLEGSEHLNKRPAAMRRAARWIARFHAATARQLPGAGWEFLPQYGRDYYLGWARRTLEFTAALHGRYPWLGNVCRGFERLVDRLFWRPPSVIHGEYYAQNILVHGGRICPVDWESAAVAAGEIDLAMLLDRWSGSVAHECEEEYRRARWPEGAPGDFARVLDIARLYVSLRWLGDRADWTVQEHWAPRFEELRSTAERLGLLEAAGAEAGRSDSAPGRAA